jgi:hypothetical protein
MEAGFFVKGFESRQFQLLELHLRCRSDFWLLKNPHA